jgi:hypothetical protein
MGDFMAALSSTESVSETRADNNSQQTIALFCMIGLVASYCLMKFGIQLGAGWV